MKPIRILTVDDDPDFRYLLTQTLQGQPDLDARLGMDRTPNLA